MALSGLDSIVRERCHIISFWDDLHYFNEKVQRDRHKLFREADTLLLPYYEHFFLHKEYQPYWSKALSFPWFPAYTMPMGTREEWRARNRNILLSGRISDSYPLRRRIRRIIAKDDHISSRVYFLKHPGYNEKQDRENGVLDADYYRFLASAKGAIATSGSREDFPIDYVVAKYFEIPACGSLLICEDIPFLERRGFVDGWNCVYLDKANLDTQLKELADDIDFYYDVAIRGRDLVDRYHSLDVRKEYLIKIMTEMDSK